MDETSKMAQSRTKKVAVVVASELAWGSAWAAFLQRTRPGRYLAGRRTWISVVIGVGGTLVLVKPLIDLGSLAWVVAAFAASSVGIVVRSLANERRVDRALLAPRAAPDGGEREAHAANESAAVGAVDRTGRSRKR